MRRHRWRGYPVERPRLTRWLGDITYDLHHGWRQLARAPGLTALIVATLAIGIGANATMAGIIDRLLLRSPAGIENPNSLARLVSVTPGSPMMGDRVSYPLALELERDAPGLAGLAAFSSAKLSLGSGPDASDVEATIVSPTYFPLLGVRPALGRLFGPDDGFPEGASAGGPPLAVLSHAFWQRHFGGDSGVVGRSMRIGTLTYTIVGVTPRHFQGPGAEAPEVWLPLTVTADAEIRRYILEDRGTSWLSTVVRMRPGVSRAAVEEQTTRVWRRELPPLPLYDGTHVVAASLIRARAPDRPREVNVALWLAGVSSLVLMIACANVTNLLLARAFARRREIAVRLALGAGRGRLARQLLAEAALLAVLGAAGALMLAGVAASFLGQQLGVDITGDLFVDARLLGFTALVALGTTVIFGLAPMVLSAIPDLSAALRTGATAGGGRTSRARMGLLGAQAALSMLMLVVAGLFAQSLREVTVLDLGLDPNRTLMVHFSLGSLAMTDDERDAIHATLRERVQAVPGVARMAFGQGSARAVNVHTSTRNADEHINRTSWVPYEIPVDSGYFSVLGSVLRGRDFSAADVRGAPPVTIINAPLAALLFPGEDALGQCVYLPVSASDPSGPCFTVVGVLEGYIYGRSILARDGLLAYTSLAQIRYSKGRPGQMAIRLDGPAAATIPAVRQAFLSVRPDMPRLSIRWMRDVVEPELRPWRVAAAMFSIFGLLALVIGAVGLYAVVSFAAVQRAPEIAVRLALGARLRDVMRVVAGEGMLAVLAGLGVGAAGALAARHWIGPLLFQTSPDDPGVMLGVAGLLSGVALLAAAVPTLRVARQDPAIVLRAE